MHTSNYHGSDLTVGLALDNNAAMFHEAFSLFFLATNISRNVKFYKRVLNCIFGNMSNHTPVDKYCAHGMYILRFLDHSYKTTYKIDFIKVKSVFMVIFLIVSVYMIIIKVNFLFVFDIRNIYTSIIN